MKEDQPLFILAGNGPYENRGCEAIVRGTVKILRDHFKGPRIICISHFSSEIQYQDQFRKETDKDIIHLTSHQVNKKNIIKNFYKPKNWDKIVQYFFHQDTFYSRIYDNMLPHLDSASAVLSIGGDNYSLDYGTPRQFTALDDLALAHGRPTMLWGASVGPFSAMAEYEQYMSGHLQRVTGIFARESATVEYLHDIEVYENVYPVADPAFLMEPVKPAGIEDELIFGTEAIGINLSPLMARYVTGGDSEQWTELAAKIIAQVSSVTEMPIYLIPHVTTPSSNDYQFMKNALSRIQDTKNDISLISPGYNAAETKWIISQMTLFAGARMHSTIAALSSEVPTLSFAYSIKSRGINQDLFGHTAYCMQPTGMNAQTVSSQIAVMLGDEASIKSDLKSIIPGVQKKADNAGVVLKKLLGDS